MQEDPNLRHLGQPAARLQALLFAVLIAVPAFGMSLCTAASVIVSAAKSVGGGDGGGGLCVLAATGVAAVVAYIAWGLSLSLRTRFIGWDRIIAGVTGALVAVATILFTVIALARGNAWWGAPSAEEDF